MKTVAVWLLVLVFDGDIHEIDSHDTRADCMRIGIERLAEDPKLDGFFCEEQLPEELPLTYVAPTCLAPTRECS